MQALIGILSKMAFSLLSERLIKTVVLMGIKKGLEASEGDEDKKLSEDNQRLYDEIERAFGMKE